MTGFKKAKVERAVASPNGTQFLLMWEQGSPDWTSWSIYQQEKDGEPVLVWMFGERANLAYLHFRVLEAVAPHGEVKGLHVIHDGERDGISLVLLDEGRLYFVNDAVVELFSGDEEAARQEFHIQLQLWGVFLYPF